MRDFAKRTLGAAAALTCLMGAVPAAHAAFFAAICDDIANPKPKPEHKKASSFFKRYRDLTAGGYYTTP